MKLYKEDLINKLDTLSGFLRHENKLKFDKKFYNDLCDEVDKFCKELKDEPVEFVN